MSQPNQPADQPALKLTNTENYREDYANSVQVRMSVWDFFLVFGTMTQTAPKSSTSKTSRASTSARSRPRPSGTCSATTSPSTSRPSARSRWSRFPRSPTVPSTKSVRTPAENSNSAPGDIPLWMLFPLFFAAIYLSHLTLLRLPYFWDEGGYYIPAAWDFFRTGSLIPHTTATNAHPPLPSILLAGWWHLSGFVVSGTRTLVCIVSASALLGVYKLARTLAGTATAAVVTFLTAIYPIWFAQSTLAHADIFAAAFTLWGLAFYFDRDEANQTTTKNQLLAAIMFSLSVLSKETAIITPAALALWEAILFLQNRRKDRQQP